MVSLAAFGSVCYAEFLGIACSVQPAQSASVIALLHIDALLSPSLQQDLGQGLELQQRLGKILHRATLH